MVWLVVALGLMVTVLFGIALKVAPVLTEVFAVGAVDCVAARVLVSLVAVLLVWASAAPLATARTAAAIRLSLVWVIRVSKS